MYTHWGFVVDTILADGDFQTTRPWFPQLNTCAAGEHVSEVERLIWTLKDSTCCPPVPQDLADHGYPSNQEHHTVVQCVPISLWSFVHVIIQGGHNGNKNNI